MSEYPSTLQAMETNQTSTDMRPSDVKTDLFLNLEGRGLIIRQTCHYSIDRWRQDSSVRLTMGNLGCGWDPNYTASMGHPRSSIQ